MTLKAAGGRNAPVKVQGGMRCAFPPYTCPRHGLFVAVTSAGPDGTR
jgi:hypothetical protein